MDSNIPSTISFGARLALAWKCLWQPDFAQQVARPSAPAPAAPAPPTAQPPERVHASAILVLSLLQREGRLIDFLQENVASFSDSEVGAAARVVHAGCKKILAEHFTIAPLLPESEGAAISIPAGFDARRIRLTGNVAGQPPFRGTLKHHGWAASAVRLPNVSAALDPQILAPAEVEL